jgi:hypothetical protein
MGFHSRLLRGYLETIVTLVEMLRDFVSKGIPRGLLMDLHKRLFKDYIGSYLSKFYLHEKVPRVLHRTYHNDY